MSTPLDGPASTPRISAPPSMAVLAADALRSMIIDGELKQGERLIETRLCEILGVSRPPLREAMRVVEQEGLIVQVPRKGAVVRPLTGHDIYEIVSLREEIEQIAIRLGVPVRSEARLDRVRRAYRDVELLAEEPGAPRHIDGVFGFHLAIVGLAGHQRLEEIYRSLSLQLRMCMAMNRRIRSEIETAREDVARHRPLLDLIETGDTEAVAHALAHHGQRTFLLAVEHEVEGHSPESRAWFARIRQEEEARS